MEDPLDNDEIEEQGDKIIYSKKRQELEEEQLQQQELLRQ